MCGGNARAKLGTPGKLGRFQRAGWGELIGDFWDRLLTDPKRGDNTLCTLYTIGMFHYGVVRQ